VYVTRTDRSADQHDSRSWESLRKAANNPVTLSCGRQHISKWVNKDNVWRSLENFATTPPCKSIVIGHCRVRILHCTAWVMLVELLGNPLLSFGPTTVELWWPLHIFAAIDSWILRLFTAQFHAYSSQSCVTLHCRTFLSITVEINYQVQI
jgi:hypothetical protein